MNDIHLPEFLFHQFQLHRFVQPPEQFQRQQMKCDGATDYQMAKYELSDACLALPTKFHMHMVMKPETWLI